MILGVFKAFRGSATALRHVWEVKHWGQKTKTIPGIISIFMQSLRLPASVPGVHVPLLALLELWMISSGRSAPSSEENVGLMREWALFISSCG